MTKTEAIQFFAKRIWDHNTNIVYGLIPSGFGFKVDKTYKEASNVLAKLGFTHFTHKWIENGKIVELKLFKAEEFGASSTDNVPTTVEAVTL